MKDDSKRAVIYCRVSSAKQMRDGDGLASQETRCREFAKYRRYTVVEVFKDDMSGSAVKRPSMDAMLNFLKKHRGKSPIIVIIDDISRLARGLDAHLKLRAAISGAGGILQSPSIEFGEDSDSLLVENLLAAVSQHQRQKNGETVKVRMRARSMNGYWVFIPPVGYRYERVGGHGKTCVRDEPIASIIQEALEGYASGRFQTQTEVLRFFETRQEEHRFSRNGLIRHQRVFDILTRIFYAGYIDLPEWGVRMVKGKHEPIISLECFEKIQERLRGASKAPARADIHADFPLRGFVTCGACDKTLTASWTQGRYARYAYYHCKQKDCLEYKKSIKRDVLEGEFNALLSGLRPSKEVFALVAAMLRDGWRDRGAVTRSTAQTLKGELNEATDAILRLLDRIDAADNAAAVAAYEKKIEQIERKKALIAEKIANCSRSPTNIDDLVRTPLKFFSDPCALWESSHLEERRIALRLTFAERLTYDRGVGFRTPTLSAPFKLLSTHGPGGGATNRRERSDADANASGVIDEMCEEVLQVFENWNVSLLDTSLAIKPGDATRHPYPCEQPMLRQRKNCG